MILNNGKEIMKQKYDILAKLITINNYSYNRQDRKYNLVSLDKKLNRISKTKSSLSKDNKMKLIKRYKIEQKPKDIFIKKSNFEYQFKELFGKITVKKKYLQELAKRKKVYSEKIKKIKIIRRNESVRRRQDSAFDIIKRYSLKVLLTNRATINYYNNYQKEKEKERELFDKLENIDKNNLKSSTLESPQNRQKLVPFYSKLNATNNNANTIIQSYKMNTAKSQVNIWESKNDYSGLRKKIEMREIPSLDKKELLNNFTPEIINYNSKYRRNNISNLKYTMNDTTKTDIIKQANSFADPPKKIEIIDLNPPKKLKRDRSELYKDFNALYYSIEPGNASYLVKNCMLHRTNWKETYNHVTNLYNFKWTQFCQRIDYLNLGKISSSKQIVNHFENHYCITNKANLFVNMMDYCEQRKISVFKYIPLTLIFDLNMLEKTKDEKNEKKLEKLKIFLEGDKSKFTKKYNDLGKYFKEKDFIEEIKRRKEFLEGKFNKIIKIKDKKKEVEEKKNEDEDKAFDGKYIYYSDYFGTIKLEEKNEPKLQDNPSSYTRNNDKQETIDKFIGANSVIEIPDTHSSGKNMWLIKAIDLCRGMCIKIVNNYKKMMYILNKFKEGVNYDFTSKIIEDKDIILSQREKNDLFVPIYCCDKIIIQKYIERPLLYKGRKCDMRVWVLVTQNLKVYFFKEGHLKTCSISFDINSKDAYTHITNYSFQKDNEYFEKYEKGNEVPFYEFQKFIDKKYPEKNYKIKINLYSQIKEIVSISMKSVKDQINKNNNTFQFEIFGYDFMLDENFNLFLIEINDNPGLEESSPWIEKIVPRMLDDALRLTIDKLFNAKYDFEKINMINKNEYKNKYNLKTIMNNFKEKIEYPNKIIKTENNKTKKHEEEKIEKNSLKTEYNNYTSELIEKIRKNINKNGKYISPFPVPGYENSDNLWEFVCDLTNKDPLDDFLDKKEDKCFTGIRYLFNKKKKNEF